MSNLGIFYDPCHKCVHKDTRKMCNMCELTYYRNQHISKETDMDTNSFDEEYTDRKFEGIRTNLEGQYEQGTNKT